MTKVKRLPHVKGRWSSDGLSDGITLAELPVIKDYVQPDSVRDWKDNEREKTSRALAFKKKADEAENASFPKPKPVKVVGDVKEKVDSLPAMPEGKVRTILKAMPENVRLRSSDGKCAKWTKTDAKVSEYVWHDYGQGNGPELVKREKLRLEALAMVMPERQPLVQRKPRTDGKKVFADYRKERPAVVVTDKAGIRKA